MTEERLEQLAVRAAQIANTASLHCASSYGQRARVSATIAGRVFDALLKLENANG